jgi:hypothetical protein
MVNRARPTQNKRARERAQIEKRNQKAAKREQSRLRRAQGRPTAPGEDPDIAGIRPGPQPSPYHDFDANLDTDTDADEDKDGE